MKTGSHNLGPNAFSQATIAKVHEGGLILRQTGPGATLQITLSNEQIALLKDVLA
jgi:hypothetical protein